MRFGSTTSRAIAGRAAALSLVGVLTFGANVAAGGSGGSGDPLDTTPDTTAAPVVASTTTVDLPLLATGLVVSINTDPGGNLVDVALNQTGDFTATTVKPNRVAFVNEAAGVRVKVKAKHGGQRIEARAAELVDVSGPGSWSGDIFGDGQATTVEFEVGDAGDGTPTVTVLGVTSPFENTIGDTETGGGEKHGGVRASASAVISFSNAGQTRTLRIKVSTFSDEQHNSAKLSIGLSRIKGAEIPEGPAVGAHTWTGMLCDGTPATVDYTVAEDGSVSGVTAVPEASVEDGRRGVSVRFATGERVSIRVGEADGEISVGVKERVRCDAPDPTVNTEIDPDADRGDDHRGDHRGDHDGDHDGWGGGDRDRGDHRHDEGDDGGRDRWDGDDHRDGDGDGRDGQRGGD